MLYHQSRTEGRDRAQRRGQAQPTLHATNPLRQTQRQPCKAGSSKAVSAGKCATHARASAVRSLAPQVKARWPQHRPQVKRGGRSAVATRQRHLRACVHTRARARRTRRPLVHKRKRL